MKAKYIEQTVRKHKGARLIRWKFPPGDNEWTYSLEDGSHNSGADGGELLRKMHETILKLRAERNYYRNQVEFWLNKKLYGGEP